MCIRLLQSRASHEFCRVRRALFDVMIFWSSFSILFNSFYPCLQTNGLCIKFSIANRTDREPCHKVCCFQSQLYTVYSLYANLFLPLFPVHGASMGNKSQNSSCIHVRLAEAWVPSDKLRSVLSDVFHILFLRQFIFSHRHNVFWSIEPANVSGCFGETARYPPCWRSLSASFSTAAFRAEHLQFSLEATKRLTSNRNWIHQSRIHPEKNSWIGVNWAPNLWMWCASNAPWRIALPTSEDWWLMVSLLPSLIALGVYTHIGT